jgi:hypothetical protein
VILVKVEEYIFNVLVNKVISAVKKNLSDHKAAVRSQLGGHAIQRFCVWGSSDIIGLPNTNEWV